MAHNGTWQKFAQHFSFGEFFREVALLENRFEEGAAHCKGCSWSATHISAYCAVEQLGQRTRIAHLLQLCDVLWHKDGPHLLPTLHNRHEIEPNRINKILDGV